MEVGDGKRERGAGAKIRAAGGCTEGWRRSGDGEGGKKNRSDVGEGGKRALREKRRRGGGERKGLRESEREEGGRERFRGNRDSGM